jgi:spore germination protein GerM
MPVSKRPRSSRKKKKRSGKYTPLVWLISAGLIALAIAYSNTLFQQKEGVNLFSGRKDKDNGVSGETSKDKSLSEIAAEFLNISKDREKDVSVKSGSEDTSQATQNGIIKVRIYVGGRAVNAIKLLPVDMEIKRSQTILKDTIEKLVAYRPSGDYINIIPQGVKIRRVWIENRIAHIDFSNEFNFNTYGLIGYRVQVYQVVHTATQFDTVDAVFFYIEGKPVQYLGGEGFTIENPVYPFSSPPQFDI